VGVVVSSVIVTGVVVAGVVVTGVVVVMVARFGRLGAVALLGDHPLGVVVIVVVVVRWRRALGVVVASVVVAGVVVAGVIMVVSGLGFGLWLVGLLGAVVMFVIAVRVIVGWRTFGDKMKQK